MLPTSPDILSLSFFVCVIAAFYVGLVIHELGHVVAGSLAKKRIAACGLGRRRPFLRVRLWGISFFLGFPLSPGLTIAVSEELGTRLRGMSVFILGGPLANVLVAVGSFGLWHSGLRSTPVMAFFWSSLFLLLGSLPPYAFRAGRAIFRTDALLAIQFWRGTWLQWSTPGQHLATFGVLRDLCRSIDAWPALVTYTLHTALYQVQLCDHESARETLASPCLTDARRGTLANRLEAFVRCVVECVAHPATARDRIDALRPIFTDEPDVMLALKLLEADMAMESGLDAVAAARESVELARRTNVPSLVTVADITLFEAEPPADPLQACREILARRGSSRATPVSALRLICATASFIARRGQRDEARSLFADGGARLANLAREIPLEVTRGRFLERASKRLREAVAVSEPGLPILIVQQVEPSRDGARFAWVGIACATLAIAGLVGVISLAQNVPNQQLAGDLSMFYVWLAIVLTTAGAVFSTLAFRQKPQLALLGLLLNIVLGAIIPGSIWAAIRKGDSGTDVAYRPDYDAIIGELTMAIERDPTEANFYRHRADAYIQKGLYGKAVVDLTRAIELQPDVSSLYRERGRAYLDWGDRERALKDFERARELRLSEAAPK